MRKRYYGEFKFECTFECYNKYIEELNKIEVEPNDMREFGRYLHIKRDRILELKSILVRIRYGIHHLMGYDEVIDLKLSFPYSHMIDFVKVEKDHEMRRLN